MTSDGWEEFQESPHFKVNIYELLGGYQLMILSTQWDFKENDLLMKTHIVYFWGREMEEN